MQQLPVKIAPAPFAKPVELGVPAGSTINDIVRLANDDAGIPQILRTGNYDVMVDGEYLPRGSWEYMPRVGQSVEVYMPVRGGGKSPLRILLSVALVFATAFIPEITIPFLSAQVATGIAVGVVGFAGMTLINAIAPIRPPKAQKQDSPTYQITGARNQLAPYSPAMVVLGKHRVFPSLGAKYYTEIVGDDEYMRVLLYMAGPVKIDDIRIGDTPIASYPGFDDGTSSLEVREGWEHDAPITIVPNVVHQDRFDSLLENSAGYVDRTLAAGYDEVAVDIAFPQGLVHYNKKGNKTSVTIDIKIRWREHGSGTWNDFDATRTYSGISKAKSELYTGGWAVVLPGMGGVVEIHPGSAGGSMPGFTTLGGFILSSTGTVSGIVHNALPGKSGLVISSTGTHINVSGGSFDPPSAFTVTGKTTSMVRRTLTSKIDRTKSYDIGLFRATVDDPSEKTADKVYWSVMRGIRNDPPLNYPVKMAQIAMRIKASEGAQNQIDIINCMVESYACKHLGGGAWESVPTGTSSNPAALFRAALTHKAIVRGADVSALDDVLLGEWYDFCETQGYKYNRVHDEIQSVWDTISDIAFAGRAAPYKRFGHMWSVTVDGMARSIDGHITPRNSWGFSSSKSLIDMPHGFKIGFNNQDQDYLADEVIAYDDGYNAGNATVIEALQFRGITDSDLAWKFGRFHIAQARLRPEMYSVYMDFEHLTFARNSLVKVLHDIPRWGDHWGRVKSVITSGPNATGVILDETVSMESGKIYACRFRMLSGASLVLTINTVDGDTNTLMFASPLPIASAPVADDLAMFNVADSTGVDLIVHSIRRQSDLVAQIFLVDYAPAIYTADTGPIPPFNTQITGKLVPVQLDAPIIDHAYAELYQGDIASGEFKRRIFVSGSVSDVDVRTPLANRRFFVRYRDATAGDPWQVISVDSGTLYIEVESEGTYELQAKQTGQIQGLHGFFGNAESPWSEPLTVVNVQTEFELGLPAPTNVRAFYTLESDGYVSRVKLRANVELTTGATPSAVALMFSVQSEPREVTVTDFGSYLRVNSVEVLNTGTFQILAGSTNDDIVIAPASDQLPDINLSGFFWASLDGIEYRKATSNDANSVQFAQPFTAAPTIGANVTWAELAFADERDEEFRLLNLVAANGSTEVAKWGEITFIGGQYRISTPARAQEGTTQVTAIKAQYYPAPGAGTDIIYIPAANFVELDDGSFEASTDVHVTIPPGAWGAATMATYRLSGMRVVRSPIIPITDWRPE
jgi:hypothetical protein